LFAAYGRGLNRVGGAYYTAEDVGVTPQDMSVIRSQTPFVAGLDEGDAASGDPSPITADGVFRCLEHAVCHKLGVASLNDISVAIQGLGSVGYSLAERLRGAGAKIIVTDINQAVLENGGGIINVASELSGTYDLNWVDGKLDGLVETLQSVIAESDRTGKNTDAIAETIALSRIASAG